MTFKGPDVPDLYITDFEVTQGMQNLENDMPLVRERTTVMGRFPWKASGGRRIETARSARVGFSCGAVSPPGFIH